MTEYKPYTVSLSRNQKLKLTKAIMNKSPITLRLSSNELSGSDKMFLTKTQINKIKKSKTLNKGVDIKISKTQISHIKPMIQSGMGLQNRPYPPSIKSQGQGLRNRPFNIHDYAQYKSPPFIGTWSGDQKGSGIKKRTMKKKVTQPTIPIIGLRL